VATCPALIPISAPAITQTEIQAVVDVLRSGNLVQGTVVNAFEVAFAEYVGCHYAVATSSGTTALQLALLAHKIGAGDEVITTPFTFVATANAIRYTGATPVFADIEQETLNLSPRAVLASVTRRTRAIIVVHLYGNPCNMTELDRLASEHGLVLVEDACQAHGATFAGRRVGTFGTGCFSFYGTKNLTCGEGGMITTSDPAIAERARLLRNHAMRVAYTHEELGFNFRMTDIHAALGLAQLSRLDELNAIRAANAVFYDGALADAPVSRPALHPAAQSAWHQYTLLVAREHRDQLAARLRERGVGVGVYYPIPVHRQPAYRNIGARAHHPIAEAAAECVLSIPVHPGVREVDRAYIATEVQRALAEL
jgi:dTDP-4-amino-4,6-dideoxygalactose transaminase